MINKNCLSEMGYKSNRAAKLAESAYKASVILDGTYLTEKTQAFVRGEITILVGREGAGKTTLVRTLAKNFQNGGYRCGFFLTEEANRTYNIGLSNAQDWDKKTFTIPIYSLFEEVYLQGKSKDERNKTWNELPLKVDAFIKHFDLDVLFIDNMTTNKAVLDYNLGEQTELFLELKAIAEANQCATVMLYHTSKNVRDNVFQNADIEGSNAPAKLAPNIVLHYNFKEASKAVVRIQKVRTLVNQKLETLHLLDYNKGLYEYNKILTHEQFKEICKG